jgi:YVTN family beta-propeller protein
MGPAKWDLYRFWVSCLAMGPGFVSVSMQVSPQRFALPVALSAAFLLLVAAPAAVAAPASALAWVSNEDDGSLTVVDTEHLAAITTVAVGKRPRGLILSRDGTRLFVALSGVPKCPPPVPDEECAKLPRDRAADGIAVVDATTLRLLEVFGGVSDPERLELSPDGRRLYVTDEDAARLTVLDAAHGRTIATTAVGREPEGVRASPDGRLVLVTSESDDSVAIVAAGSQRVLHSVAVGKRPRDIAITPDSRSAYVSGEADASVFRFALPAGEPAVRLVQLRSEARPMGVALDAKRGRLYVSTGRGGSVAVIAAADGALIGEIAVGARPWGLALSGDGRRLVTANGPSGEVAIIDTDTLAVLGKVRTGHGPWGVVTAP